MVADVFQAVELERKFASARPGMKATLKDLLGRVVADYNKMVSLRRHRIDAPRRSLLYNMSLGSESFCLWADTLVFLYLFIIWVNQCMELLRWIGQASRTRTAPHSVAPSLRQL